MVGYLSNLIFIRKEILEKHLLIFLLMNPFPRVSILAPAASANCLHFAAGQGWV